MGPFDIGSNKLILVLRGYVVQARRMSGGICYDGRAKVEVFGASRILDANGLEDISSGKNCMSAIW